MLVGLLLLLIHCHLLCSLSQLYSYQSSPEFCVESSVLEFLRLLLTHSKGTFSSCAPAEHFFAFLYRSFILTLGDTDTLWLNYMIFFFRKHSAVVMGYGVLLLLSFQYQGLKQQRKNCYCGLLLCFFSIAPLFGL